MAELIKIEQKIPQVKRKKRVAAYARVSVDMEQSMKSLVNQMDYYRTFIQDNPEWEYAGVYADGGFSGTSTDGREKFKELVSDCEVGKIDLVLVKSISRFARNTVDLLNTVRHLKDIGVEVRFERENINTFSGDGELLLTILASYAQEESESISRNAKWAINKKFEQGKSNTSLRSFGYDWDPGTSTCVINEEEARWVRYIYKRFLEGTSINKIAREMKDAGVKGLRGEMLSRTTIRRILTNELYVGDVLLQKYYSPQIRKPKPNKGEVPKYLVSDDHPGIVSREDFKRVQEELKRRGGEADNHGFTPHPFASRVRCGKCGYACCHVGGRKDEGYSLIECVKQKPGECDLLPIREDELREACGEDNVQDIVLFDDHIELTLADGTVKSVLRDYPKGRYSCFTGKLICSNCGCTFVRMANTKRKRVSWICNTRKLDRTACEVKSIREDELVEATQDVLGEGNYKIRFYSEVEKVMVYNDKLEFYMKKGGIRTWQRQ